MVISIMNRKGGSGKTTTTFQLSHILSERGYKVLAVDLDGQASLTLAMAGDNKLEGYLPDYFVNPTQEHSLICILSENLHFIPNEETRSEKAANLIGFEGREGQERLKNLLDALKKDYDFILIDCPPARNVLTVNALIAADRVLIPTETTKDGVHGVVKMVRDIDNIRKTWGRDDLKLTGIFKFRPKQNTTYQKEVIKFLTDIAEDKLMKTSIRENVKVQAAQAQEKSITAYDPKSNGAIDYAALVDEIIEIENI